MGTIGIRVADILHDGHASGIVFALESRERGMKSETVIELQCLGTGHAQGWTRPGIEIVGEGDDGIESVVAAAELDDNKDA